MKNTEVWSATVVKCNECGERFPQTEGDLCPSYREEDSKPCLGTLESTGETKWWWAFVDLRRRTYRSHEAVGPFDSEQAALGDANKAETDLEEIVKVMKTCSREKCDLDVVEGTSFCIYHQYPFEIKSWRVEVIADTSGKWCGNALRFKTEKEALAYGDDLFSRWTLVRDVRVVPCDMEPNQ